MTDATDATEAARRILAPHDGNPDFSYPIEEMYADAQAVARALLAGHDKTVERCAPTYESEAARRGDRPLRVRGVCRDAGEPRSIGVALTGIPTDDEMRDLHEFLSGWSKP